MNNLAAEYQGVACAFALLSRVARKNGSLENAVKFQNWATANAKQARIIMGIENE